MYINENHGAADPLAKKFSTELNDLVLKKLINLGTNHRVEFKQILAKWPAIKTKIETAFKQSAGVESNTTATSNQSVQQVTNLAASHSKAPKIQLKNFANFK